MVSKYSVRGRYQYLISVPPEYLIGNLAWKKLEGGIEFIQYFKMVAKYWVRGRCQYLMSVPPKYLLGNLAIFSEPKLRVGGLQCGGKSVYS